MPSCNFDIIHYRHIPGDIKYEPVDGVTDVIPMWIADMDFCCPPAVSKALHQAADHGIFGYTQTDEGYDRAVVEMRN